MLRLPSSHEEAAATAALRHELRVAKCSNGSGANQSSGQQGSSPVPNQSNTEVDATARNAEPVRRLSIAYAMNVPSERAPVESAKLRLSCAHASAQVEHDKAVGQGAHLENDLPRVIFAEIAALHAFLYRIHHQVGRRGGAGLEIPWIAAGALARLEEHKFEKPRA